MHVLSFNQEAMCCAQVAASSLRTLICGSKRCRSFCLRCPDTPLCLSNCSCRFGRKSCDAAGREPHPARPRGECVEAGQRSRQVSGDGELTIPWFVTPNYHYGYHRPMLRYEGFTIFLGPTIFCLTVDESTEELTNIFAIPFVLYRSGMEIQ